MHFTVNVWVLELRTLRQNPGTDPTPTVRRRCCCSIFYIPCSMLHVPRNHYHLNTRNDRTQRQRHQQQSPCDAAPQTPDIPASRWVSLRLRIAHHPRRSSAWSRGMPAALSLAELNMCSGEVWTAYTARDGAPETRDMQSCTQRTGLGAPTAHEGVPPEYPHALARKPAVPGLHYYHRTPSPDTVSPINEH